MKYMSHGSTEQYQIFLQRISLEDDVVLDPFCGSGSACLAAIKDGRHYIGYDIEEKYVQLANQRIKHYTGQKKLFENQLSMSIVSTEIEPEAVNRVEAQV
jgi:DNA modification methylase